MNLRPVLAATTVIGTLLLLATPLVAQTRQKAQPDHAAPARSFAFPPPPAKTATPRATTGEEAPAPPPSPPASAFAPAQPQAEPPRLGLTR
jgi:hypothetical protein